MELDIRNFTEAGNNLMWRKSWETFQREHCKSKSYVRRENKVHYDRILNSLTDNRSIDIRVDSSLDSVRKMPEREFLIKYIQENKDRMTPVQIAIAIAVAVDVPVEDTSGMRTIFNLVMEELKKNPPTLAEVSIAIDDRPVEIIADDFGVRASENPISFQGVPSVRVDLDSGERGIFVWEGDNQAPVRGINPTDAGERITEVPAQFSVPTILPPPVRPLRYNREAIPNTSQLPSVILMGGPLRESGTQTEGEYPNAPVTMSRGIVGEYSVARENTTQPFAGYYKRKMEIQTAQTGEQGMLTTQEERGQTTPAGKLRYNIYPTRRVIGSDISQSLASVFGGENRTSSGAILFSPTGPFSFPTSGEQTPQ